MNLQHLQWMTRPAFRKLALEVLFLGKLFAPETQRACVDVARLGGHRPRMVLYDEASQLLDVMKVGHGMNLMHMPDEIDEQRRMEFPDPECVV